MTSGLAVFADNLRHADTFRRKLRNSKMLSNTKPLYNYLVITAGTPFSNQTTFHERVGVQLKSALLSNVMQVINSTLLAYWTIKCKIWRIISYL